jgi:hypothetical protein
MQSGDEKRRLAVVHLVWIPFGPDLFRSFIRSYQEHPAGCDHDLIMLYNGIGQEADAAVYHEILFTAGISYTSYFLPSGMDIEAYYWIAAQLSHTYILFLNSYSQLLADHWGRFYLDAVSGERTGAVSATGSWQSYYSTVFMRNTYGWEREKSFSVNVRKYKLFVKAFLYWRLLFRPFPNPHLRTNAFIIKRELFLSISHPAVFRNKFTAYVYESGKLGLSGQLLKRGYELLVVDRYGRLYTKDAWKTSAVFWIGGQDNLLVSDNQTLSYDQAGATDKKKLAYLAWGK